MCSIGTNATADAQLTKLKSSNDEKPLEKKLKHFAGDSSIEKAGILDSPANHLHGMPDDLRRIRTGRHRVFYTGHHTQCSFSVFFIKAFKRKGKNDELDKPFHRILKAAAADTRIRRAIRPPDPPPETESAK